MKKLAIGLMSGTSLDGIDVVIAKISGHFIKTKTEIIAKKTYPFEKKILAKIKRAMDPKKSSVDLICSLNFELAYLFSQVIKELLEENNLKTQDISFIGSHGHTLFHINNSSGDLVASSLQIGDGSVIANVLNIPVVFNFRTADIAVFGKGAPLVPYTDFILYRHQDKSRSIHNLGGISNMTVIKKNAQLDDLIAFDTGPANMMIDFAVQELFNLNYDQDGLIARSGRVIKELLRELLSNSYFKLSPPKSTGREVFGDWYTKEVIDKYQKHPKEDIVRTLTEFTATSIVDAYNNFILNESPLDEIYFCGGGANNKFLLALIQEKLPNIKILKIEDLGSLSDYKEALAFAILANETLSGRKTNVMRATGAKKAVILGQISGVVR